MAVLDANWSHNHTVPSRTLYPHQWSWETGFIDIGLAQYNPERAWRDLRTLFEAQWPDGRVPHIVFEPSVPERHYFPGPAFWQTPGRRTTGIVQPPVHALATWEIYQRVGAAGRDEVAWLYPRLVAQQRYLAVRRDVGGGGLACLVHPWESGQDNSPAWDPALAAIPVQPNLLRGHPRRDVENSAVDHRPTDADYARYLAIAQSYRDGHYADAGLADRHPFLVECPAFNAINGAAEAALARLAEVVGADPAPHLDRAARITHALVDRLYDPGSGMFHARDLRTGRLTPARYAGGLIPLILADLPAPQTRALLTQASSPRFGLAEGMSLPLPSYDRTAGDFDPLRYWRGPVWINVNWLIWRGLRTHGYTALADELRGCMLRLVERSGCYEYFHPDTGAGIGSPAFSWTAALALDLLSPIS